jgi:CBS domain-containing protein
MTTVASRMTRNVLFVREQEPLSRAVDLFEEHRIRHLPVLAELERFVGLVTDRDVKLALPSPLCDGVEDWRGVLDVVPVSQVMSRDLVTIGPEARMEEAVRLLIQHRVGCVPVVEEGSLVGLLTVTDAMRYCIEVIQTHGG